MDEHRALMSANSNDEHFSRYFRDRYPYRRLWPPQCAERRTRSPWEVARSLPRPSSPAARRALKRVDAEDASDPMLNHLRHDHIALLPNTSGVRSAKEAVFAAQLAREALETNWLKLEIHPDPICGESLEGPSGSGTMGFLARFERHSWEAETASTFAKSASDAEDLAGRGGLVDQGREGLEVSSAHPGAKDPLGDLRRHLAPASFDCEPAPYE